MDKENNVYQTEPSRVECFYIIVSYTMNRHGEVEGSREGAISNKMLVAASLLATSLARRM